jgi:hypothetical protein
MIVLTSHIINCSYEGSAFIPIFGGGILGRNVGINNPRIYCIHCSSTAAISDEAGGIVGFSSKVNLYSCFSTGEINYSGGGICGYGASCNLYDCYSTGSIGSEGGGIVGRFASNTTATRCFSFGNIGTNSGGIYGPSSSSCTATHCYSTGAQTTANTGIFGSSATSPTNVQNYSTNNLAWSDAAAISAGLGTTSENWFSTAVNTPWQLRNMGYSLYTLDIIDSDFSDPFAIMVRTGSDSAMADQQASVAIGTGYTFAILSGNDDGHVTIDTSTGILSSSVPGTYTLSIYAYKNPYYFMTYTFTVIAPETFGAINSTTSKDVQIIEEYPTYGTVSKLNTKVLGLQQKVLALSVANVQASSTIDVGRGFVQAFPFPFTATTIPGPIVNMYGLIGNAQGLDTSQGLRLVYYGNSRATVDGSPSTIRIAEIANTGTDGMRAVGSSALTSLGWSSAPFGHGLFPNQYSNLTLELYSGASFTSSSLLQAYSRVVVQYLFKSTHSSL